MTEKYIYNEPVEVIYLEPSEDDYDVALDEIYGSVDVCGFSFQAFEILKEFDPIAYRCGYLDYVYNYEEWQCSACHKIYSDEHSAENCCMEEPYECAYCNERYSTKDEAIDCYDYDVELEDDE